MDEVRQTPESDDRGFLGSLSLFASLRAAELETLRVLCHRRRHAAGSVILRQGQLGTDLYMVRTGEVAVRIAGAAGDGYERGERELARLGGGALFGEMALFDSYPRSASVVALTEVLTLRLSQAVFTDFARGHPTVLMQICKVFCHRLRDTNALLTKR